MSGTVEIAGVSKCYGDSTVVRDISFGLGAAETVALVGHNGAGKTTLIKLMLGLIRPTKGLVRVLGENRRPAISRYGNASAICRRASPSTWR